MLLIDGIKYELWTPPNEDEFERMVKEHAKDIFGEESIYLDLKQKLKSKSGVSSIPDGYVIVFGDSPCWHIIEVELSSHPLYEHIVQQISKFVNAIRNPHTQREIADALYEEVNSDDLLKLKVKKAIEPTETYRFLSDLISRTPVVTIIIEKHTEELDEALSALAHPQIKVVEFQTFVREGVGLAVHVHLFEPLYPLREEEEVVQRPEKRGGGKRYPVSTQELLNRYGNELSNVEGMTWKELYESNPDGNFRYFKVRIPLVELDQRRTGQG